MVEQNERLDRTGVRAAPLARELEGVEPEVQKRAGVDQNRIQLMHPGTPTVLSNFKRV